MYPDSPGPGVCDSIAVLEILSLTLIFSHFSWYFWLVPYEDLGPVSLQSAHRLIYNLQYIVVCSDQLEIVSVIIHWIPVSTAALRQ